MKKLLIIMCALFAMAGSAKAQDVATPAASADTTAAPAVLLPSNFFGSTLGYNTKDEVKKTLESRKVNYSDYNGSIVIEDVNYNGMKFSAAMLQFDADGVFNSIDYLNTELEKDQLLDFSNAIYGMLSSKYVMIERIVDNFKCYFTSVGGYTCILSTAGSDGDYYVDLKFCDGEVDLKGSQH